MVWGEGPHMQTIFIVLSYGVGGRGLHNKKSTKYEADGISPREHPKMRWLDRLKSGMRIHGINQEMATGRERCYVLVKTLRPPRRQMTEKVSNS